MAEKKNILLTFLNSFSPKPVSQSWHVKLFTWCIKCRPCNASCSQHTSWLIWHTAQLLPRNKIKLVMAYLRHNTSLDCHCQSHPASKVEQRHMCKGTSSQATNSHQNLCYHIYHSLPSPLCSKGWQWNEGVTYRQQTGRSCLQYGAYMERSLGSQRVQNYTWVVRKHTCPVVAGISQGNNPSWLLSQCQRTEHSTQLEKLTFYW